MPNGMLNEETGLKPVGYQFSEFLQFKVCSKIDEIGQFLKSIEKKIKFWIKKWHCIFTLHHLSRVYEPQ